MGTPCIYRVSNVPVINGKHSVSLQEKQKEDNNMAVHRHISIRHDQDEFLEKHYISLSAFVQDMIDKYLLGVEEEACADAR